MARSGAPRDRTSDGRQLLHGYKGIVAHIKENTGIDLDVAEVCRYAKWAKDALPVMPLADPTKRWGRVKAWADEVDDWVVRHFRFVCLVPREPKY